MLRSLLALFTVVLVSFSTDAQELDLYLDQPEFNVLYRKYDNEIKLHRLGKVFVDFSEVLVKGFNCTITEGKEPGEYIVSPGSGKIARVLVFEKDGETTLKKFECVYRVSNLPDPTLYWGGARPGNTKKSKTLHLSAKYPPEIPLSVSPFKITKWTLSVNGESVTGIGQDFTLAEGLLKGIDKPSMVAITATVIGQDGIPRLVGGAWLSVAY